MLTIPYFPNRWKFAGVVFITNKNNQELYYRLSAHMFTILHWQSSGGCDTCKMKNFAKEKNFIPQSQFAFREKHSRSQQILRLLECITKAFDKFGRGTTYKIAKFNFPKPLAR
jgi:hypothetical protein